jgi:hypothetical protein
MSPRIFQVWALFIAWGASKQAYPGLPPVYGPVE